MLARSVFLEALAAARTKEVVVTTMSAVRPWAEYSESELDFASADSAMGHAADFALGIALARPERRVMCLNGDGSMLMSLGSLATIVTLAPGNFILCVLENGTYEITGNQQIPGAGIMDLSEVARAVGFGSVVRFTKEDAVTTSVREMLALPGPVFASVPVRPESEGPISRHEKEKAAYLKDSLAVSARRLKRTLARSK
jgi:sulfopyruvate decarboxylase subunit beta